MQNKALMMDFVFNLLSNNLPEKYYYHNPEHTLYVYEKALEIGRYEGCTSEELGLIGAAALWHDTGYISMYSQHEEESCRLARKHLQEFGYTVNEISQICDIIMATKIPQKAKTKLEEIIADADLEYLGTDAYETKSASMFHELCSMNPALTESKWVQMQKSFLQNHHYFTRFCIENREPVKQRHLEKLNSSED